MTAIRFALVAVAMGMMGGSAFAQVLPVVQVAPAIHVADEADPRTSRPQGVHEHQVVAALISDAVDHEAVSEMEVEWIDVPMELPIVEETVACNCGEKHCHGVCRDPGRPRKPLLTKPGDRDRGDCPPLRYRMDDCQRAGKPHCVHRWAKCGINDKYSAWFVGGGSPFPCGRPRTSSEGTWGLDYGGFFGYTKIWLNYTRGRNQGGIGAYRTDGEPKIVSRAHDLLHLGH